MKLKGKLTAALGLAAGYVLGSRGGREHYEKIKSTAQGVWKDPRVQDTVHNAESAAKDKAQEAAMTVKETVKDKTHGKVDEAKATAVDDSDAVRKGTI